MSRAVDRWRFDVIPRNSHSATNITTTSEQFADPALVFLAAEDAAARATESSDAALARIVAALNRYRPAFFDDAACRGSGLDFTNPAAGTKRAALEICGGCDVRRECLRFAVEAGDVTAVMGGTDGPARRPLVKAYQKQQAEQRAQQQADEQEIDDAEA